MLAAGAVLPQAQAAGNITAFPGAEGAGKYATGGRGGKVYHVTNLNDSGTGSFRDAVSGSNRIVVFDVGGTIELKSDVVVKGNITIAGQTAPGGGGITLKGYKLGMGGDNIIVRYVSSRPGEKGSGENDGWGGSNGSNSIVDHCSIGWANDEQFALYSNNMNQTVQYSIIGPSNCISTHAKGAHGFGVMFGKGQNSWHHNMIAHNISRNFRGKVVGTETMDFVNNVIYGWGYQTGYGTMGHQNYVNNYLKQSPSTKRGNHFMKADGSDRQKYKFYMEGNKLVKSDGSDYNTAMNENNWNGGIQYCALSDGSMATEELYRSNTPFAVKAADGSDASVMNGNVETADEAFETVLSYAGAGITADSRPKIDKEVMEQAKNGTGNLTGGRDFSTVTESAMLEAIEEYDIKYMDYEAYYPPKYTSKEITDSDNDGMPDEWELARGLDPNKDDAIGDYLGQGYNNIEYYINDLTVDSFPPGVVTLSQTTADLGEDYQKAKEDAAAITLSPTSISSKDELKLPSVGSVHGSRIEWVSSSSALTIKNNEITAVVRPAEANEKVTLVANVTYGDNTVKKSVGITLISTSASWTPSASNNGAAAGTRLMDGLTNMSELVTAGCTCSVNGESFTYYASGTENGGWADGAASGTAFKYTAAESGFLAAYITKFNETKSAYIIEEGANSLNDDSLASISGANGTEQMMCAPVEAGKTYYILAAGTKGRFVKIAFDKSAPPVWWRATADVAADEELMTGLYPAEAMKYVEKTGGKDIDGITFAGNLAGVTNPSDNGAAGASLKFRPPADGTVTVYYKLNSTKTFKINDAEGNVIEQCTNEDEASDYTSTTAELKGGVQYYMYVAGSKAEFYGVRFIQTGNGTQTTPKPAATNEPDTTKTPDTTSTPTVKPPEKPPVYENIWWRAAENAAAGAELMKGLSPAEAMTYKESSKKIDVESFTGCIAGSNNPSNNGETGAALHFTAENPGTLTVYYKIGNNKTFKINDSEGNIAAEYSNNSGASEYVMTTADIKENTEYRIYVDSSKAEFYGVHYVQTSEAATATDKPSATEQPGDEVITFNIMSGTTELTKLETGTVTVAVSMENPQGRTVYAAQYGADGRLLSVKAETAKESFDMTVEIAGEAQNLRMMLWNEQRGVRESVVLER